ncbi:uncharacterized protein BDZ99DRAFT_190847 [Mytilinidion resinicola]|uniref:Uncharacterized protein n=1 Tax=Mytilinidion resinicola TaxID=574789 RepID=A0A6A6Z374_9PEZI|nr:uncharacterized protein BDZ99DRAFT_190847 [Mytilinidion resinicola]KAF2815123.1 hypothetical protein BDZ99DRAFT_190847 [Mytilinidion resinicola]
MATKRKTKSPKSGNEPKKRRESAQSTRTTRAAAKAELEPQADPTSDSEAELGQHVENSANRASNNETAEASATQAAPQVEQHVLEDNRTSATETAEASAIQATSHIEQLRSQVADYERQVKAAYSTSRLARPKIDWQGHLAGWAAQSAAIANSINPDLSVVNFPTVLDTELASWRAFMDMGGDITLLEHMDFMLSVLWCSRRTAQRGWPKRRTMACGRARSGM